MLKAIIIDDDFTSCELISEILENYTSEISVIATESHLLHSIKRIKDLKPDIVFLDIELPDGKGLDLFQFFPEPSFAVIIITAHNQYIMPSIPFRPHHLLLKPIKLDELLNAVQKILINSCYIPHYQKTKTANNNKLVIRSQEKFHVLLKEDIIRCEANGSYTTLFLKSSISILVSQSIGSFEKILICPEFIRVHHKHIINTRHIKLFDRLTSHIILSCDTKIPLSFRKRETLINYIQSLPSI